MRAVGVGHHLHGGLRVVGHRGEVPQLLAHHGGTAHHATQRRLACHPQLDVVGNLVLGSFGSVPPRDGLGVGLGLQQTGDELGLIDADL